MGHFILHVHRLNSSSENLIIFVRYQSNKVACSQATLGYAIQNQLNFLAKLSVKVKTNSQNLLLKIMNEIELYSGLTSSFDKSIGLHSTSVAASNFDKSAWCSLSQRFDSPC
jgi:hypothetical protein